MLSSARSSRPGDEPDPCSNPAAPSLTIVVPNRNHARYLPKCLAAIAAQERPPDEVIVIDDASSDDSVAVIESFAARLSGYRVIRHDTRRGVVDVINRALSEARSTHVLIAAADDWILPDLVLHSMALLTRYPEAGLCSALSYVTDERGEVLRIFPTARVRRRRDYVTPQQACSLLISDESWFMGNTAVLNRRAALDAGGFRRELRSYCDMFLYNQIALRHGACFLPEPLAVWRRLAGSYSSGTLAAPQRMLEIHAAARVLMTGEYHPLFPADYVRRWERRWRYAMARGALDAPLAERPGFLATLPQRTAIDAIVVNSLLRLSEVGKSLAALYLFARLRAPDTLSVLERRLHWLLHDRESIQRSSK